MMGGISPDAPEDLAEDGCSESLMLSFRDDANKIDCLQYKHMFGFGVYNPILCTVPLVYGP